MDENQTPRVPDLWWSPLRGKWFSTDQDQLIYYARELPSDAVKLGDVEALKAKLATILTGWRTTALSTGDVYESIRAIVEGENR